MVGEQEKEAEVINEKEVVVVGAGVSSQISFQ